MTSIWKVQLLFAGTVPPVKVTLPDVELTVPPAQVVLMFAVAALSIPVPGVVGNVSVTLVTVIGPLLELAIVTVKVDIPPEEIDVGANAFASVGALAVTVKVAVLDTAPVVASLLDTPVALLGKVPGVLLLMMIDTVQLPLAGIVSPVKFNSPVWLAV